MEIRLYHEHPLPLELRSSFELPAWPYNEKHYHLFEEYMLKWKIFRYEDSVMPEEGGERSNAPFLFHEQLGVEFPLKCYFSHGYIDNNTFRIIQWPLNRPHEIDPKWLENIQNHPIMGDMFAWSYWNTYHRVSKSDYRTVHKLRLTPDGKEKRKTAPGPRASEDSNVMLRREVSSNFKRDGK